MPHLGGHLISRKLFTANLFPQWYSEYTSKVDDLALLVMATNSWQETTQISLEGFRLRLHQTLIPLVSAPNYLSSYLHCCLTAWATSCMLKVVLTKPW